MQTGKELMKQTILSFLAVIFISSISNAAVVAIVDTGIDFRHQDITPHLLVNSKEYEGNKEIDDDNNGYVMILLDGTQYLTTTRSLILGTSI